MDDRIERIERLLAAYPDGVHRLGDRAAVLDSEWPASLSAVYWLFDGAELFHETIRVLPARDVVRGERGYRVAEHAGDDIEVDPDTGAVWRLEKDTAEWLEEASAFDRWLIGAIDAEALIYDDEGEYRDDVFDAAGEPVPEIAIRRERCMLKRDKRAPAPTWRIARLQWRAGDTAAARRLLEELVDVRPAFAWAWFDLARISEQLGEIDNAYDEAVAAGDADTEHAAFFYAHAARFAVALDDERRRAAAADRALVIHPGVAAGQREGAEERLTAGDIDAARELAAIAAAVAPRDLQIKDLVRRIEAAAAATSSSP